MVPWSGSGWARVVARMISKIVFSPSSSPLSASVLYSLPLCDATGPNGMVHGYRNYSRGGKCHPEAIIAGGAVRNTGGKIYCPAH